MRLKRLFTDDWVHVFHGLVFKGWGRVETVGIGRIVVGKSNAAKSKGQILYK